MKSSGPKSETVRHAIALLEKASRKEKQALWKDVATRIGKPRRNRVSVNLWKLATNKSGKEFLLVPGKVLGFGQLEKPVKVIALEFSESAAKKIGEKGKAMTIKEALEAKVTPDSVSIVG
tara:strand:+ start:25 stop:384 length:360 start_codon:yes stop_codon:yes gene_type:complete